MERIVPRNLTDGYLVYENWKRLTKSIDASTTLEGLMANDAAVWKPFYDELSKYPESGSPPEIVGKKIKPHMDYLVDLMDGVSDLSIAESVYQATSGNYERAAAVLDGLSGDGQIPIPEVSETPRSGVRQTQRVVLAIETEPLDKLKLRDLDELELDKEWSNPRQMTEPNLNKLLKTYYGDDISFWLDSKDSEGNGEQQLEVKLQELGLEAIDLLYIQDWELRARLQYYAKKKYPDKRFDIRFDKKKTPVDTNRKSLPELRFLIRSLQEMLGQGQPLKSSDFTFSMNDLEKNDPDVIREVFQRFYDTLLLLAKMVDTLTKIKDMRINFTWDKIEGDDGDDSARLKDFLKQNYDTTDWIESLQFKKDSENKTINISNITHSLSIRINTEPNNATKATLIIDGKNVDEFVVKRENDDINVYLWDSNAKEEARGALLKASLFGVPSAIPLERDDSIINSAFSLDKRIELTVSELESGLGDFDKYRQMLSNWKHIFDNSGGGEQALLEDILKNFKVEAFAEGFGDILKNKSFVVLPPFLPPKDLELKTAPEINKKALKWIQKASYVKPRLKLFDNVLTYNEIFETEAPFSFYYDEKKFNKTATELLKLEEKDRKNPVSLVIAISSSSLATTGGFPPSDAKKLAGLVIDEWIEKIPSPEQDTTIAFHYDAPNSEAPQCLLLAVSPNDRHDWTDDTIADVVLEAMDLMKIRAVDYRSVKELANFLPTIVLNSSGEDVYIRLRGK
jgi:hypothetical protein